MLIWPQFSFPRMVPSWKDEEDMSQEQVRVQDPKISCTEKVLGCVLQVFAPPAEYRLRMDERLREGLQIQELLGAVSVQSQHPTVEDSEEEVREPEAYTAGTGSESDNNSAIEKAVLSADLETRLRALVQEQNKDWKFLENRSLRCKAIAAVAMLGLIGVFVSIPNRDSLDLPVPSISHNGTRNIIPPFRKH